MIKGIKGPITEKKEESLIIDTGIFLIEVLCNNSTLSKVQAGDKCNLYTFFSVKEDSLTLYGFLEKNNLTIFEKLISVSGVGPKIALSILDNGALEVQESIINADINMLSSFKGIGKKTAERIVLELKDKISVLEFSETSKIKNNETEDAKIALEGLGFKAKNIDEKLKNLPKEISSAEEIITWFLQNK